MLLYFNFFNNLHALGITFIRILDSKMLKNYGYIKNNLMLNFGPLRTRDKEIRLQNSYRVFFKTKKVVEKVANYKQNIA